MGALGEEAIHSEEAVVAMVSCRLVAMVEAWGKVGMASYNKVASTQAPLVAYTPVLAACTLLLVDCILGVYSKQ